MLNTGHYKPIITFILPFRWIYLEPIFNNGTMKSDGNAFQRIDKDFRYIMKHINDDNRLLSIVKINNIPIIIESLESQLTRCQSALKSFITVGYTNSFTFRSNFIGSSP